MRYMSDVSAFRDMRMVAAFVAVQKSEGVADDIRFSSDMSSEVGRSRPGGSVSVEGLSEAPA